MTDWDDLTPRLHDLIDGRLAPDDERELRALAAREPEVARRLHELEWMVHGLAGLREERAPVDFSSRVLAAIDREEETAHEDSDAPVRRLPPPWALSAAAALLLSVFGLFLLDGRMPPASREMAISDAPTAAPAEDAALDEAKEVLADEAGSSGADLGRLELEKSKGVRDDVRAREVEAEEELEEADDDLVELDQILERNQRGGRVDQDARPTAPGSAVDKLATTPEERAGSALEGSRQIPPELRLDDLDEAYLDFGVAPPDTGDTGFLAAVDGSSTRIVVVRVRPARNKSVDGEERRAEQQADGKAAKKERARFASVGEEEDSPWTSERVSSVVSALPESVRRELGESASSARLARVAAGEVEATLRQLLESGRATEVLTATATTQDAARRKAVAGEPDVPLSWRQVVVPEEWKDRSAGADAPPSLAKEPPTPVWILLIEEVE